ncbi:PREDICTED: disintegrin and metalloproteinase domain-containing protein 1-like [Galeopterus variegatus]|uniref:Disintegrin and metalloproteinase domain-containing protein 1-like n=1 Tax=Galeopterus variegatus TaxID=482537 RepID=A0ABM0QRD8_GALVR|nr:PREDICTED: disintegrin and metalloproteinase domain-containing protein 1-like [Galeopterus variegatus]
MSLLASLKESASILPSLWKNQVTFKEAKIEFETWAPQKWHLRLGRVPLPSCVQVGVLMLVVIFLPSIYCHLGSVYYSFYEIIIPKRLTVQESDNTVKKASYLLFMQGQEEVIHLKVKTDDFMNNFPVYSYHSGILRQEMPYIAHDCHYEGYIEGVPGSFVSVNTCAGLRGILIKEEKSYGIKPMNSSKRFEHVLYTMAHQARVSCSVTSKDNQVVSTSRQQGSRKPHNVQALSYLWSHTKYVEMFVVVDNQRFQMWGSNINETVQRVVDIIALANSFTRGINTEVVLAGMEIWTEGDLIEVPVDLQVTLRNFNSWRRENLFHRVKHDVAHMIVGHHPGENMGQAFLNGACSSGFAAAVESFHHEDVLLFAALMVHELGHNLGIRHDHSACICKDKHLCLMHENITKESGFSNCSSDSFYQFLHEHKGDCLFNKPWHKGRMRRASRCGNGVVEDWEQCDCGSACHLDPCCDPVCKLKESAECGHGLCCTDCTFRRKGFLCRPSQDECDLPEYCNGMSAECPADSYKQDGTLCDRIHYCSGGQCKNPDKQCTNIYGYPARSAPEDCYSSMNKKGDRFGNCGHPTAAQPGYVQCADDNIFCGKLICTDVRYVSSIQPQHTVIQVPHKDDWCWSMDAHNGSDIPDYGDVQGGTYCAPNKVCINYSCIHHSVLNYDCKPEEMCHGKGVCNNLRHCHCEFGFAPPDCQNPGNGGSVDSGPPGPPGDRIPSIDESKSHRVSRGNAHRGVESKDEDKSLGKIVYIIPVFLLALFLGLIIVASIGSRKEISQCSQGDLEETSEEVVPEQDIGKGQEEPESEKE